MAWWAPSGSRKTQVNCTVPQKFSDETINQRENEKKTSVRGAQGDWLAADQLAWRGHQGAGQGLELGTSQTSRDFARAGEADLHSPSY